MCGLRTAGAAMTTPRRILLIQGHPDPLPTRFGPALQAAYAEGARAAGHEVREIIVAALDFPMLRSVDDWKSGTVPAALAPVQQDILWARHLVWFFPLWLGDMPALLKAFLEQVARPGWAFDPSQKGPLGQKALAGRSARVVVTMGMPALVYRHFYRAHSVRALERNVLGFIGIGPIHETLVGQVESPDPAGRQRWLGKLRALGAAGA
jgi:putative NADPH-quinone reductase